MAKYKLTVLGLVLIFSVILFAVWDGSVVGQISNSGHIDSERNPDINGNNGIWFENDNKIIRHDGNSARPTLSGTNGRSILQISGTNVVWREYINGKYQIMFWNGSAPTRISSGTHDCYNPQISGNNVVWEEDTNGKVEIKFWNGTIVTRISSGTNDCYNPQISGDNVVWQENGQIMFWNGGTATQISSGNINYDPQISGTNVGWFAFVGGKKQVMFWNGGAPTQISSGTNNGGLLLRKKH